MPIPKAAPNDVYSTYFQFAVFCGDADNAEVFLDTCRYEPAFPVRMEDGRVWISAEDLRRIYAPYLHIDSAGEQLTVSYGNPDIPVKEIVPDGSAVRRDPDAVRVDILQVMAAFGKTVWQTAGMSAVAIDAPADAPVPAAAISNRLVYLNILAGKDRGEMNYAMWYEPAERVIPYRMYIPFGYRPGVPQKTLICFHGGDANADYMFKHTHGEIELYAEKYGYILLALTSYRKYTFFGASRFPTGSDKVEDGRDNPLGLDETEWQTSIIAEESVMAQIEDACRRYDLDMDHLYALGNSGGSLGIFRQVQAIGRPFFRAAAVGGGVASPWYMDYDALLASKTAFLLLMSTEDHFDGQFTGRVAYPVFKEHGMDVTLHPVGGGAHLTGWTLALDAVFDFFEKH